MDLIGIALLFLVVDLTCCDKKICWDNDLNNKRCVSLEKK